MFTSRQENESPASSLSSTLGLTVLRALIGPPFEPLQSRSLGALSFKNHPATSTGIGQASRRPAGPIHQPGLTGIWALQLQGRPETKAGLCT